MSAPCCWPDAFIVPPLHVPYFPFFALPLSPPPPICHETAYVSTYIALTTNQPVNQISYLFTQWILLFLFIFYSTQLVGSLEVRLDRYRSLFFCL